MLTALVQRIADGEIIPPIDWRRRRQQLWNANWVLYCKPPFGGPEQVLRYLGRYTHRVAVSNHRLQSIVGDEVTIRTHPGNTQTLSALALLRRFVQHVLPAGFVRIRHDGLHASPNVGTKLRTAKELLRTRNCFIPRCLRSRSCDWRELMQTLTGVELSRCPRCHHSLRSRVVSRARAPPQLLFFRGRAA